MQNRCLRVIFGKKNWPGTEQAHPKCNLLYVENPRNLSLLKYAHCLSFDQSKLLDVNVHSIRSNQKILLKSKHIKGAFIERAFSVESFRLWNELP